jgi:hypothetical protein
MTGITCFAVYVMPSGRDGRPQLVGPFAAEEDARRYCERIEESANGTLLADVIIMSSP